MSIIKDVTVKINNGTATLDAPVQFYEKDHDVELRIKLMDYKYKYDKDPQNMLNSVDEDILEAYTTIVNPLGHELEQINGVVKNDTVIFRLDPTYTDELDEIGTYKLQIHIKCTCSEFTIPPITFEVLERLKGIKVVTDGEDEVDNSQILDNTSNFVSDETGKLIIEWKKGDTISSAKLNAMVDVINDAVDEEVIRKANEIKREQNANDKIQELENTRVEYINKIDNELDSFADQVDESMSDYETRFNALIVSQQQDAEVIDARDGEQTLKARLDRDMQKPSIIYEDVEGSYITCDSTEGYTKNIEIKGNTIQSASNLADIRSVGDAVEGQELYEIPVLSRGKNLINEASIILGEGVTPSNGQFVTDATRKRTDYIKFNSNTNYVMTNAGCILFYDANKQYIGYNNSTLKGVSPSNCAYVVIRMGIDATNIQLEEGTVATPYEPYQEDKLTILSPVQLEKVGDVRDRIIEKDGVWGVEKNVVNYNLTKDLNWVYGRGTTVDGIQYFGYKTVIPNPVRPLSATVMSNLLCNYCKPVSNFAQFSASDGVNTISQYIDSDEVQIMNTSEVFNSVDSFKNWISDKNISVKYPTTQPQFIPLPHDQQIKLRTFANKTNISFLTEIEGTIKAQVPKSLGATVNTHTEQINNLNKELDRVKKLEESTVSTVTTESDFTTVEATSNGYFEDVKLEGKTLVNLCKKTSHTVIGQEANNWDKHITLTKPLVVGNKYTLIVNVKTYTLDKGYGIFGRTGLNSGSEAQYSLLDNITKSGIHKNVFTAQKAITMLTIADENNSTSGESLIEDFILLEGDHTQNPPSYFEGLKSVGQSATTSEDGTDEIVVSSVNENLFDVTKIINLEEGGIDYTYDSNNLITVKNNTALGFGNYMKFKAGKTYYFSGETSNITNVRIYPVGKYTYGDMILGIAKEQDSFSGSYKCAQDMDVAFRFWKNTGLATVSDVIVSTNPITEYTPHQSDKKRLLYYNNETQSWEKPILRQWDSIEKHSDGKYYYHKRSGEVVLNGGENWTRSNGSDSKAITSYFGYTIKGITKDAPMYCDKFSTISSSVALSNYEHEGIRNSSGNIYINITKSKLPSDDMAGFKAWLQANPTTVVYQLEQEEVYECTNIDLITYANETNYIVESGAICPKSTLKVMCNINNVVRELQIKVSNLENYIQHVMIDALNNALNE